MEHFPLVHVSSHDLEWSTRVAAKIAQEIPAWREGLRRDHRPNAPAEHPVRSVVRSGRAKGLRSQPRPIPLRLLRQEYAARMGGRLQRARVLRKWTRDQSPSDRGEAHLPL